MTINQTSLEYHRQIESIRHNNMAEQNKTNKLVLIAATVLLTFVGTMLLLNHLNVLNLS